VNASTGEGIDDYTALAPTVLSLLSCPSIVLTKGKINNQDVLRRLPGINEKNIENVKQNVDSLFELAHMSVTQLRPLLGNAEAHALFHFFQHPK